MIEESWKVLTLLIVLMSMASFYRPFIGLLNQINKPEKFSQIILISVLLNIIMNIFLIPIFGIFGAAISTGLVFILESYLIYKTSFITLRRVNY
ncbi:polysaccharide biosynthesis C-terminal domain-containing protein [Aliarcobacter butzleri]